MAGFPTYKGSVMAKLWLAELRTNYVQLGLNINALFYGDQRTFPESPTTCVEPAQVLRELVGTPMITDNQVRVAFIVYSTDLESTEAAQDKCDEAIEKIEDFVNLRSQPAMLYEDGDLLGGTITAGWVESVNMGYLVMADRRMRANRLVWVGETHTHLVLDQEGAKHA